MRCRAILRNSCAIILTHPILLRNHALCYRVGDVDGSGGGEEKRIPVASITAVEIDNEMRYAARNSGAILAPFWRNSGAILAQFLVQFWRNSGAIL